MKMNDIALFKQSAFKIQQLSLHESTLGDNEVAQITGGGWSGFGTGPGGIFSAANIGAASRFAGGLGLLVGSAQVGWSIGTAAYNTYTRYRYP